jgi:hypothetical protein
MRRDMHVMVTVILLSHLNKLNIIYSTYKLDLTTRTFPTKKNTLQS